MKAEDILLEVYEKYGEHIEAWGDDSPALVVHILCTMVAKERETNQFRRTFNVGINTTNS